MKSIEKKKHNLRIIEKKEHKIDPELISKNAVWVVDRLKSVGYDAYIVGGAVRDLLSGREPKDFDVVTDATPSQVRRIFRNSRVIGRRFRLVHIYFSDMIIETSTFRADPTEEREEIMIRRDNEYGTIEDDVTHRDFGFNALYYDPVTEVILDYVDGYEDIHNGIIKTLKKENISFLEDPVRMLRAVKYSTLLGFTLPEDMIRNIKKYAKEISKCSKNRLYEEINKILKCGKASVIFELLYECKLLKYLIPFLYKELDGKYRKRILDEIRMVDELPKDKEKFEYETYWAMALLAGMENSSKLDRSFANELKNDSRIKQTVINQPLQRPYLDACRAYVAERLLSLNIPKKICDDIGKAFYIYKKFGNWEMSEKLKQFKFQSAFAIAIYYFDFFCTDSRLVDYVKSLNVRKKNMANEKRGSYRKKKKTTNRLNCRKVVMTKKMSEGEGENG